jgi:hypothetical protein
MYTFVDNPLASVGAALPAVLQPVARPATQARHPIGWRRIALATTAIAAPAIAGLLYGRATTRRGGLLVGGLAALAALALRVERARWFTPEPAFDVEGKLGGLELRRYRPWVEASVQVEETSLEAALHHGYRLLAGYATGNNDLLAHVERTTPALIAMRDGHYTISFVMPPGRTLRDLPWPDHPAIELREVSTRRIAALRFRGRFTHDNIAAHERQLLQLLVNTGLAARGSVSFAAFDSPATVPLLRRNELWIDLA